MSKALLDGAIGTLLGSYVSRQNPLCPRFKRHCDAMQKASVSLVHDTSGGWKTYCSVTEPLGCCL